MSGAVSLQDISLVNGFSLILLCTCLWSALPSPFVIQRPSTYLTAHSSWSTEAGPGPHSHPHLSGPAGHRQPHT